MKSYDFHDLESLRRTLDELIQRQVPSLAKFHEETSNGFRHRYDQTKPDLSESSTATCVLSLIATGAWSSWRDRAGELAVNLLNSEWQTSGLPKDNAYTTAFVLEAVTALSTVDPSIETNPGNAKRIAYAVEILRNALARGHVQLEQYPPSGYLTQLAVRVLKRRNALSQDTEQKVRDWASHQIDHQLALLVAQSRTADLFQLAYATILVASLGDPGGVTPDQHQIIQAAVDQLFARQDEDGSWPRSLPLFHYPGSGSAYCYEYEMLVQLLEEPLLQTKLLRHLDKLSTAARTVSDAAYQIGDEGWGWSSGHHPQFKGPESWTTASVFHFAHALDRLVAEAIRRSIFAYLDQPYTGLQSPNGDAQDFASTFLDSPLYVNGARESLHRTLIDDFMRPLMSEAKGIGLGRSFSNSTPMSAIFFGPPGTSKTELTREIADYLGWPRVVIDPSHFVRHGLDQVQAEADRIFGMLAAAEQIVVLLDEFDEMARDRHHSSEVLSRFLTTAMLPKLAAINKRRRIVFIVATNYIDHFDMAISRLGRFDRIYQVMPPTAEAKRESVLEDRPELEPALSVLDREAMVKLDALTFGEFNEWKRDIQDASTSDDVAKAIDRHFQSCTLNSPVDADDGNGKTWTGACLEQRNKIRCSVRPEQGAEDTGGVTPIGVRREPITRGPKATSRPVQIPMEPGAGDEALLDLPQVVVRETELSEEQRKLVANFCKDREVGPDEVPALEKYMLNRLAARSQDRRRRGRPKDVEITTFEELDAELGRIRGSGSATVRSD